jgi:branched-chain amino acid transport system substrate-binding protein
MDVGADTTAQVGSKSPQGRGKWNRRANRNRRDRVAAREMLKSAGAAIAAATLPSVGLLRGSRAAEPVNIGGLYPVTGNFAQIGQGCVNAAKLAVEMVNDAGGIKSLGGAKLNLIVSDVQSDPTVTRTETDRLIGSYKPSAIHGAFASALTLIASEVAERAKVPLITGSSTDQLNQGRHYTFTPFARASQFARAQLQMARLVSDKPKVAVVFENTAFGTSTSKGLREQAPDEGVEIVLFEPYSARLVSEPPKPQMNCPPLFYLIWEQRRLSRQRAAA